MDLRAHALAEAQEWLGTPYLHQASNKGAGCDCLGLVRGVWRKLYGAEPQTPPPYTPDWSEASGEERLYGAASRWLVEIDAQSAAPGDVLLFRMRQRRPAKHLAILGAHGTMIHAHSGQHVAQTAYSAPWRRRTAFIFTWPPLL